MNRNISDFKDEIAKLDKEDILRDFRTEFYSGPEKLIYLDGNSLGKLPLKSKEIIDKTLSDEWGKDLIRAWNSVWWEMPVRAAAKLSTIIGAKSREVIITDSTSVNLYKLIKAALREQKGKKKIVSEELSFPTDLYIIQGVIDELGSGHSLELATSGDGISVKLEELERSIDNNTALVVLSYVSYKSASMYDMKKVNDLVHRKGALIIWDLSHAAGAVKVDLDATGADMAVGCTYKYLNCGPGSPAYLYINSKLIDKLISPIWGWFGEINPFEFSKQYRPSDNIRKFMAGTPGILSMCGIEPALDIIKRAGMDNIRRKNSNMTEIFIEMARVGLSEFEFEIGSPEESKFRGSHVSLRHPDSFRISRALLDPECGKYVIIPDFRPPDNLRFGFSALYNTFDELYLTIYELRRILSEGSYRMYSDKRGDVT